MALLRWSRGLEQEAETIEAKVICEPLLSYTRAKVKGFCCSLFFAGLCICNVDARGMRAVPRGERSYRHPTPGTYFNQPLVSDLQPLLVLLPPPSVDNSEAQE